MALGLVVALIAACGGSATHGGTAPAAGGEELKDAAAQARGVVKEAYDTLRRGNVGGLQPLLSETVFAVGPGAGHVWSGRAGALDALGFAAGRKHRVTSRGLVAVSSPSGKSAWVADQLKIDGVALRLSAVVAEVDELWVIVALELSMPVTDKEAETLGVGQEGAQATSIPGGVDEAARDIVKLFQQAAAAPEARAEQLADRREAVVIGRGPKEFTRGARSIRRAWKKALKANPKMSMTIKDEVRASVTPDGALGWVAAEVEASGNGEQAVPHRYFTIYERSEAGWRMVAMHAAVVMR